ncbi:MAG: CTP-dependent riboflavin kinase [Caldisphaeraceae archaeon]|nr:CTP-dependent riboflavin kinase [Caldisphaeraceae archaeon]MEB3692065.1 CTP-dependent riboflavin kinase [Caldisphaeraceae archaeon]MEB3797847.1 CTP-dependent riboflavin kinase [Caldisphaeraceae archaeon]
MCDDEIFKAVVFSGKKEGEFFVSIYAKNIKKSIGFVPYPGTLNARLVERIDKFNECLDHIKSIVIEPPVIAGMNLGKVIAYPILLFSSTKAYVLRPEITLYNKDVVEIISDKRLRDELNLSDGSIVEISLSNC